MLLQSAFSHFRTDIKTGAFVITPLFSYFGTGGIGYIHAVCLTNLTSYTMPFPKLIQMKFMLCLKMHDIREGDIGQPTWDLFGWFLSATHLHLDKEKGKDCSSL
jgi:hypothetical protein